MNSNLTELILYYSTKAKKEVEVYLSELPRDELCIMLIDLLTTYYNDLNSSTLRELAVVLLSGYTPNEEKLGYNGYKILGPGLGTKHCEVKPVNIRSHSTTKSKKRLNGGGNFTDYTWDRFDKNLHDNPNMITAGFIDGRLIYICEFPFNSDPFLARLMEVLERKFPNRIRASNDFLRSANFTFEHYKDAPGLKVACFVNRTIMLELEQHFQKRFRSWLQSYCDDC